jgi:hypothetical protein
LEPLSLDAWCVNQNCRYVPAPIHLIDLTDSKDSAWPKEILTIVFLREKSISENSSLQIKNKTQVKTLLHAISATFLLKT